MSAGWMTPGALATWRHTPRGGYGYTMSVNATIVIVHGELVIIEAETRTGAIVKRRVLASSLRERPRPRPAGVVCKCCGTTLAGVAEVQRGSGVYDRLCPERDGDMCEAAERPNR